MAHLIKMLGLKSGETNQQCLVAILVEARQGAGVVQSFAQLLRGTNNSVGVVSADGLLRRELISHDDTLVVSLTACLGQPQDDAEKALGACLNLLSKQSLAEGMPKRIVVLVDEHTDFKVGEALLGEDDGAELADDILGAQVKVVFVCSESSSLSLEPQVARLVERLPDDVRDVLVDPQLQALPKQLQPPPQQLQQRCISVQKRLTFNIGKQMHYRKSAGQLRVRQYVKSPALAELVAEPHNEHDRHAVQVRVDGEVIAYVPKEFNQKVQLGRARVHATRGPHDWTIEAAEKADTIVTELHPSSQLMLGGGAAPETHGVTAPAGQWACEVCTLLNPSSLARCAACEQPSAKRHRPEPRQRAQRVVHNVNGVEGLTILYEAFSEDVEQWLWEFCPPQEPNGPGSRVSVNGMPYHPANTSDTSSGAGATPDMCKGFDLGVAGHEYPEQLFQLINALRDSGAMADAAVLPGSTPRALCD